jgi:hypothetical protein
MEALSPNGATEHYNYQENQIKTKEIQLSFVSNDSH